VLTEATLQAIERTAKDAYDGCGLVSAAELCQLIAAARVANAAALLEREERDAGRRKPCVGLVGTVNLSDDPQYHVNRARADLARALRSYTAPKPVEAHR
jgi:hypothetical protein